MTKKRKELLRKIIKLIFTIIRIGLVAVCIPVATVGLFIFYALTLEADSGLIADIAPNPQGWIYWILVAICFLLVLLFKWLFNALKRLIAKKLWRP
ncbi:MAG TPA: hypothetical protein PLI45_03690 [Candidatus Woesebacteria bacterium]|nr:hypothetical protein [Candidatus Woesebacteria bacterium]